jgi:hypothetical protein
MITLGHLVRDRGEFLRYLVRDKDDPSRARVAYAFTHNMATDDPLEAIDLMRRISDDRTIPSVVPMLAVFMSYGAHDGTRLSQRLVRAAGVEFIEELGLGEHYAIGIGHADRRHPHVHLGIDRRHPGTGKLAPAPSFAQIHRAAALVERGFGIERVRSRLLKFPDEQWPRAEDHLPLGVRRARQRRLDEVRATTGDESAELLPDDEPFLIRARANLKSYFDHLSAQSWTELEADLAARGYRLVPQLRGHSIADAAGAEGVGAYLVSRFATLPQLEQRFAQTYAEYRRRVEAHRPTDVERPSQCVVAPPGSAVVDGRHVASGAPGLADEPRLPRPTPPRASRPLSIVASDDERSIGAAGASDVEGDAAALAVMGGGARAGGAGAMPTLDAASTDEAPTSAPPELPAEIYARLSTDARQLLAELRAGAVAARWRDRFRRLPSAEQRILRLAEPDRYEALLQQQSAQDREMLTRQALRRPFPRGGPER